MEKATNTAGNVIRGLNLIEKDLEKMGGYMGINFSIEASPRIASVTVGLNFDVARLCEYIAQLPEECPDNG
jgi:hypothetical protein